MLNKPGSEHTEKQNQLSREQEWAEALQKNREKVFFDIVGRYKARVYYLVRNILVSHDDADDAAQNTFIKIWEKLHTFRSESALYTWIYRIATNEALTLLRRRKPGLSLDDVSEELMDTSFSESAWIDGTETERKLQEAINKLPLKQKLVFCLRYFEELNYEQIATITETSVGALKASYFHAVQKIETFLKQSI